MEAKQAERPGRQAGVKGAEMESDGAEVTDLKVFAAVAFCLSSSDPPPSTSLVLRI